MPSRSHLFISGNSLTLKVEHTQEISPKSEWGLFLSHPSNHYASSRTTPCSCLGWPIISHRCSGRTLEMPCFTVISQRRQWQPTPVLLPGKPHGQRSLVGCSPWGREELDRTQQLHFHFSISCTGEGFLPGKAAVHWFLPKALPPSTTPRRSKMQVSTLVRLPTHTPTLSFSSQIPANHQHCRQQHDGTKALPCGGRVPLSQLKHSNFRLLLLFRPTQEVVSVLQMRKPKVIN